jgi:hypothetical protein
MSVSYSCMCCCHICSLHLCCHTSTCPCHMCSQMCHIICKSSFWNVCVSWGCTFENYSLLEKDLFNQQPGVQKGCNSFECVPFSRWNICLCRSWVIIVNSNVTTWKVAKLSTNVKEPVTSHCFAVNKFKELSVFHCQPAEFAGCPYVMSHLNKCYINWLNDRHSLLTILSVYVFWWNIWKITANKTVLLIDTEVKFRNLGWGGAKFCQYQMRHKGKSSYKPCVVVCLRHDMLKTGTYQFLW